jgi:RimJ/RimL family protein N-acetyltransferase
MTSFGSDGGILAREYQAREKALTTPRLDLGRIALRPVRPLDYDWLFELETHPLMIHRWRLNGATPSPETFQRMVWEKVVAQFLVIEKGTNARTGLVLLYAPDAFNGTAQIAFVAHPDYQGRSLALDGVLLFIDYVFATWNLRKLYGESMGFNFGQFASEEERRMDNDDVFRVEGVLRQHSFFGGKYWDKVITAIYREDWERVRENLLGEIERLETVGR